MFTAIELGYGNQNSHFTVHKVVLHNSWKYLNPIKKKTREPRICALIGKSPTKIGQTKTPVIQQYQ
jgi:hypothetical protein